MIKTQKLLQSNQSSGVICLMHSKLKTFMVLSNFIVGTHLEVSQDMTITTKRFTTNFGMNKPSYIRISVYVSYLRQDVLTPY